MLRRILVALAIFLAPVLVYRGVLEQPLESDARFLSVRNSLVTGDGGPAAFFTRDFFEGAQTGGFVYLSGYYRPITNTLFWVQYRVGGAGPLVYNLTGMLLHGLAALLLGLLVSQVGRSRWAGGIAAGIWVAHPVHAFAVTEPAALADPLATVLYLGALLTFARTVGIGGDADSGSAQAATHPGWLVAASGLYLLALLSKESGITFPAAAVALALLAHFRDGGSLRVGLVRTLPFWGLFVGYLVWRFGVLGIVPGEVGYADEVGALALWAGVAKTVVVHLVRIVAPWGWEFPEMHPGLVATASVDLTEPMTLVAIAVAILLVVLALSWRRQPEVAFWVSLFVITYSPLARADNIGGSLGTTALLAQERWIYLPAIAVIGGLAVWGVRMWSRTVLDRSSGREPALASAAVLALLGLGLAATASTHARVQRDPLAQLAQLYEVPDEALGRVGEANRLMYYAWRVALPQGDLPEAVSRAERAVDLVPDSPIYRARSGRSAWDAGETGARRRRSWTAGSTQTRPFSRPRRPRTTASTVDFNRVSPELLLVRGEAEANLGIPEGAVPSFCLALARGLPVDVLTRAVERTPGVDLPLSCG